MRDDQDHRQMFDKISGSAKCCAVLGTSDSWRAQGPQGVHQAPLSMGFPRQEYWRGVLFPTPADLPHPGIEPGALASPVLACRFFTTSTTWEAQW